ncbi:hypothetical protein HYE82_29300 [Streptomyces sp. BR123]|uniref:hypothetical protein n=1 Tax=Streptomyces sp. BR123 TaxID=2749828 RepID=UPI0015C499F0|nr:hypothetical protein [Streptomyces sp. BR123]NXY98399.1 hypothetical protein [Streptomyces sp. BR123]
MLQQAEVVRLARRWSQEERRRAAAHRQDPRIGAALHGAQRFGIAEVLAAGPELLAAWQNAWVPGAHPRGAAVVAAAVDCRRAGLQAPVSRARLHEARNTRRYRPPGAASSGTGRANPPRRKSSRPS